MNSLQTTLLSCEQKIQHFFSYKIKLVVLPHINSTLGAILDYVCLETNISKNDILSTNHQRSIVEARQVFCYLAKKNTEYSLTDIGRFINRNHATVIYSIRTVDNLLETDKIFINTYSQIIKNFTPDELTTISTES